MLFLAFLRIRLCKKYHTLSSRAKTCTHALFNYVKLTISFNKANSSARSNDKHEHL